VCGRFSEAWVGYCEGCEQWDTYRSGAELQSTTSTAGATQR